MVMSPQEVRPRTPAVSSVSLGRVAFSSGLRTCPDPVFTASSGPSDPLV